MNASDVLRAKGNALYTVTPDASLWSAVQTMAEFDIGSVVVMDRGQLAGMLTFREVFQVLRTNDGRIGKGLVGEFMNADPTRVDAKTDINDLRRTMLESRVRYIPVMDRDTLVGVISFHDVARAVLEEQGFENRMLKDYIRDWPQPESVSG
jgi:CBS domain-containing protein